MDAVGWLRLGPGDGDARLRLGQATMPAEDARPEVAWATPDMFYDGLVRPFFRLSLECGSMRWLHSPAAGLDLPGYRELLAQGIRLTTSHVNRIPIAEYVISAVLCHYQRPGEWQAARADKAWRPHEFREVYGTTWLIVGLGAIGGEVAIRARAFGALVLGVRRHPIGDEPVDQMLQPGQVEDVLPDCDVVVLAAPGSKETRHLVNASFLGRMREGSVLVNVGRGSLVDEVALVAALDNGVPEAAILDVFETEPLPAASPLCTHPRVVVTPHSSAGGLGRHGRGADLFLENLTRYRSGLALLNEVTAADLPERHG
ncbi:MAG TPA: D-2-hydroxyacid dehydrogenase [Acidimicrobiales bacterium]|nr:D-2-hydroxyacid dehydrogenase [Acidimicrobiales bacterium]